VSEKKVIQSDLDPTEQIEQATKWMFDAQGTIILVVDNLADESSKLAQRLPVNCSTN